MGILPEWMVYFMAFIPISNLDDSGLASFSDTSIFTIGGLVKTYCHSYGHLLVITGYKWDYTFHKWGYKYL